MIAWRRSIVALLCCCGCDRPPLVVGPEPAAAERVGAARVRTAAVWIRFDNGRLDTGAGLPTDDRLTVSAVFGDADPHDVAVVQALVGQSGAGDPPLAPDTCAQLQSVGQGLNPGGVARPRSWVQLLDAGNLELRAAALRLPLRVQLVPAVIDATRGVRYSAAVDHGRNYLAAGMLSIAATGGDGIAPFTAVVAVPRPVRISYIGDTQVHSGTVQSVAPDEPLRLRWGSVDGSAELELRIGSEAPGQMGWIHCILRDDGEFVVPKLLSDTLPQRQAHRPWSVVLVRRTVASIPGFGGTPLVLELADGVHVD